MKLLFTVNRIIVIIIFILSGFFGYAQNVGINGNSAVPNSAALLDLNTTAISPKKGLLIPRVSSSERLAINPLTQAAQGLLVYQTDGIQGFYYNTSLTTTPTWIYLAPGADNNWSLLGNTATTPANFLGTIDNQPLIFKTFNTERMRLLSSGQFVAGGTAANAGEIIRATGTYAINGYTKVANGNGVYGNSTNATGVGMLGANSDPSGTGVLGSGNNVTNQYLTAGQGGAFTGFTTGLYARSTTAASGQAIYSDQFGDIVRVNYYNGTLFKINGAGTVSTVISDGKGGKVNLYAAESPEIFFSDYGQGKLVNGKTHIDIDPLYAANVIISAKHPMRVYVQLEGDCKGVYVTNKTATGFDVIELGGGTSNVAFQWNVVCNRADEKLHGGRISKNADVRFGNVPGPEPTTELKRGNGTDRD